MDETNGVRKENKEKTQGRLFAFPFLYFALPYIREEKERAKKWKISRK